MAGPESQSSSAGATIKVFNRVEEAVSFLAGSCSYRGCRVSFSCLSFSSWDETARLICVGAIPHNKKNIGRLLSLVLGIRRWLYRHRPELGRSLKHAMIGSRLGTRTQQRRNTEPGLWCGSFWRLFPNNYWCSPTSCKCCSWPRSLLWS